MIQLALMCGGLALATWGCGFLDMVFNGENSQTMKEANVCDDLGSEYSSKIPSLVELRTDRAGITRYRALRTIWREVLLPASPYIFSDEGPTDLSFLSFQHENAPST